MTGSDLLQEKNSQSELYFEISDRKCFIAVLILDKHRGLTVNHTDLTNLHSIYQLWGRQVSDAVVFYM